MMKKGENCELVLVAVDAMKMLRYDVVSDWERVMPAIFVSPRV